MAYPTICQPCLDGIHSECKKEWGAETARKELPHRYVDDEVDLTEEVVGGGFCVCGHGEPENAFQQAVREKVSGDR